MPQYVESQTNRILKEFPVKRGLNGKSLILLLNLSRFYIGKKGANTKRAAALVPVLHWEDCQSTYPPRLSASNHCDLSSSCFTKTARNKKRITPLLSSFPLPW